MRGKNFCIAKAMDCCSCFGLIRKSKRQAVNVDMNNNNLSEELLLDGDIEDDEDSYDGEVTTASNGDDSEIPSRVKRSEDILNLRMEKGLICRQFPVKETHKLVRTEVIVEIDLKLLCNDAFECISIYTKFNWVSAV